MEVCFQRESGAIFFSVTLFGEVLGAFAGAGRPAPAVGPTHDQAMPCTMDWARPGRF